MSLLRLWRAASVRLHRIHRSLQRVLSFVVFVRYNGKRDTSNGELTVAPARWRCRVEPPPRPGRAGGRRRRGGRINGEREGPSTHGHARGRLAPSWPDAVYVGPGAQRVGPPRAGGYRRTRGSVGERLRPRTGT